MGDLLPVSDTTYRLSLAPDETQRLLDQLAKGDTLRMSLSAYSHDQLWLELTLDGKTAHVARAVADAWR